MARDAPSPVLPDARGLHVRALPRAAGRRRTRGAMGALGAPRRAGPGRPLRADVPAATDRPARSLARATASLRDAEARVEAARARGMLMVDAQVTLDEARQQIVLARTLVHAAYPSEVEEGTGLAVVAARKALEIASRAFRRDPLPARGARAWHDPRRRRGASPEDPRRGRAAGAADGREGARLTRSDARSTKPPPRSHRCSVRASQRVRVAGAPSGEVEKSSPVPLRGEVTTESACTRSGWQS